MANSDPVDMIDAGIGLDCLGLNLLAWAESSTYLLDGDVPVTRVRRLPGWSRKRQDKLVVAGLWRLDDDVVHLVGYLVTNTSRSQVERISAARRNAGQHGGLSRAESARRDEEGRFASGR
jgi:hypothetical protein